jgi:hypothetical protein
VDPESKALPCITTKVINDLKKIISLPKILLAYILYSRDLTISHPLL